MNFRSADLEEELCNALRSVRTIINVAYTLPLYYRTYKPNCNVSQVSISPTSGTVIAKNFNYDFFLNFE